MTQVAADPGSERTEDDNTERRDETGDEDVENEERMESDVVSNDVESDPQNTYLQVTTNPIINEVCLSNDL